jgi:hypothetical protein
MHDIVTCDPPWQPMEERHGVNLRVTLQMGRARAILICFYRWYASQLGAGRYISRRLCPSMWMRWDGFRILSTIIGAYQHT